MVSKLQEPNKKNLNLFCRINSRPYLVKFIIFLVSFKTKIITSICVWKNIYIYIYAHFNVIFFFLEDTSIWFIVIEKKYTNKILMLCVRYIRI